jgi:Na+-translocating ferredoxin:NAD+ oxidoreductase subunit B
MLPGVSDAAVPAGAGAGAGPGRGRTARIAERQRNPKWQQLPLRIEMSECINCDACLRHCPPQFGAIFNVGTDVVILPELCSGCDKCLPACPVDCIYPFADWQTVGSSADWWDEPGSPNDPYLRADDGG